MKISSSIFVCLFCTASAFAQLDVTTGYTDTELAETLIGEGIELVSVTLDCPSLAFGKFECIDCNLGIDSGIVLTTGRATYAEGPNNSGSTGYDNGTSGDPDLNALPGVGTTYDACVLELDIIPNYDTVRFDYVFGSDEYLEFVGSINDAFAFWISGPGIVGDVNIALIPGTTSPVTIDNVNNVSYDEYYVNNPSSGSATTDPYYIEYDGFTTVLTAFHEVTPCETYHLKLAVGDESDHIYDSGVFLKAKSLATNYIATFTFPGSGFGLPGEYCTTGTDPSPDLDSAATSGTWSATPSGLIIDATTGEIDLSTSSPGTYTISNTVTFGSCDVDTTIATSTVIISSPPIATFSYTGSPYCSDSPDPSPVLGSGAEMGTFSASPAGCSINSSTGTIDVSASSPGTYTITNTIDADGGCPSVSATTSITIIDSYDVSVSDEICSGDSYILPDGSSATTGGTYISSLVTAGGCDSIITTTLTVYPVFAIDEDIVICEGDTYIIPSGSSVSTAGTYTSYLFTDDGCDSTITTSLTVIATTYASQDAEICSGEFFELPDGVFVSSAGTFTSTIPSDAGCDSIVTTNLTVHSVYSVSVSADICTGSTYVLPDGSIASGAGTYYSDFFSIYGCDSTIITTVSELDVIYATVDAEMCEGDDYMLPDGNIVSAAGTYVASYTTVAGCDSIITTNLTVNANPVASFPVDDIICIEAGAYLLNATPSGGTYAGTAVSGNSFSPTSAGVGGPYTLTYYYTDANGCSDTVTALISVDANYAEAFGDTTIIAGDVTTVFGNTGGNYYWTPETFIECPSCNSTLVYPVQNTTYTLNSVDENGCFASDAVYIYVLPDPGEYVFVPNSFSPNGDNVNDFFMPYGPNLELVKSMMIYDRWGELVFERTDISATDVSAGWNGTKNGLALNPGVYAYQLELEFEKGEMQFVKGNVTIVK
ncbi:MAG: choice-of-anchor L domain-containing protein [Chitinophagales bacterium]